VARTRTVIAFAAGAAALSACSAVLGLDAPSLDPCASGSGAVSAACADATGGDVAANDAAREGGASDAAADQGPPPANAIRCGGNGFPQSACAGQTPYCCQTTDDAGATSYACSGADACAGYEIKCASYNDCAGMEICCHFNARITCATQTNCGTDPLVCEPDGAADQCPTGQSCHVVSTIQGVPSAYWQCGP
jgi:hypothetical protein